MASVGVGLAGIVSALAGAAQVVISDYPAPVVLANTMRNVEKNIPDHVRPNVKVQGHEWGVLDDEFARDKESGFTRVIAADW